MPFSLFADMPYWKPEKLHLKSITPYSYRLGEDIYLTGYDTRATWEIPVLYPEWFHLTTLEIRSFCQCQ